MTLKVGILALQGDVIEHRKSLESCAQQGTALKIKEVRTPKELEDCQALILPGGESTTIGKLLAHTGLDQAIKDKAAQGMPLYGTCAGAIILAKTITGPQQAQNLQLIDIEIERNAFGRQLDSFITDLSAPKISQTPVKSVFIRAPRIKSISPTCEILIEYKGEPVMVRENNIIVTTFHPELTDDTTIHQYFLNMIPKQ